MIKTINEHTDASDAAKSLTKSTVASMKSRAASTMETTAQVINSTCQNLEDSVLGMMPDIQSLRRTVQNVRKQVSKVPSLPNSRELLEVSESYQYFGIASGQREISPGGWNLGAGNSHLDFRSTKERRNSTKLLAMVHRRNFLYPSAIVSSNLRDFGGAIRGGFTPFCTLYYRTIRYKILTSSFSR